MLRIQSVKKSLISLSCLLAIAIMFPGGMPAGATEWTNDAPWMKGVDLPPVTDDVSPTFEARLVDAGGGELADEWIEDKPVRVMVVSDIFGNYPPRESRGVTLTRGRWTSKPYISWLLRDSEKGKTAKIRATGATAVNQMNVGPPMPSGRASINVFINREMEFEEISGRKRRVYVNATAYKMISVKDITPPVGGFKITVENLSGSVWAVENPLDNYPAKLADVHFQGRIFDTKGMERNSQIKSVDLGKQMVISPGSCSVYLPRNGRFSIEPIAKDNYLINSTKTVYGISNSAGEVPEIVGESNPKTVVLGQLNGLASQPYLFIQAEDAAGNEMLMYVRIVMY